MTEYDASRSAYAAGRRLDPRMAAAIERALGEARSVVDAGPGAGSYESATREVIALGQSAALPLADDSVDAGLAVLTVHHWEEPLAGLAELRRVARGSVVVLTFDPEQSGAFWLVRDYLPEAAALDEARLPAIESIVEALGGNATVERVPIPHDCRDSFLGAFWRRPELYLEPAVRPGISTFGDLDPAVLEKALGRLRDDLDSGVWRRRYGGLLTREELDLGYRLVVSARAQPSLPS